MFFPLRLILSADEAGINALNIGVKSGSPGIIPCLYDKKQRKSQILVLGVCLDLLQYIEICK